MYEFRLCSDGSFSSAEPGHGIRMMRFHVTLNCLHQTVLGELSVKIVPIKDWGSNQEIHMVHAAIIASKV